MTIPSIIRALSPLSSSTALSPTATGLVPELVPGCACSISENVPVLRFQEKSEASHCVHLFFFFEHLTLTDVVCRALSTASSIRCRYGRNCLFRRKNGPSRPFHFCLFRVFLQARPGHASRLFFFFLSSFPSEFSLLRSLANSDPLFQLSTANEAGRAD